MKPRIEAIHLVALAIDERRKQGTPEHKEAVKLSEAAKKQWLKQRKKCPHCGR